MPQLDDPKLGNLKPPVSLGETLLLRSRCDVRGSLTDGAALGTPRTDEVHGS